MRFKNFLLAAACAACITLSAGAAQADNHFNTSAELKRGGINVDTFRPVCFAPDGNSILGYFVGGKKDIAKGQKYSFAVLNLDKKGAVTGIRTYSVNIPFLEQVTYTPDGKAIVFTSRSGATFQKLDLASGKVSTILEHKFGTPGFRCYPLVMSLYGDKIVVNGFFYDKEDYAERDSLAYLDPSKTGVEAFTKIGEVQKAKNASRKNAHFYHENLTSPETAFLIGSANNRSDYFVWKVGTDPSSLKQFDKGQEDIGIWGFADRLLYSVKRAEHDNDLMLYDAKSDKKIPLAQKTAVPYRDLFLSVDGTTAIFSVFNAQNTRCKTFFARESNGWKVEPIKGYSQLTKGIQRLSNDGKRMMMYNDSGLRIFDVE